MRLALIGLLLLAGCSDNGSPSANVADPEATQPVPKASPAAAGGALTGTASALNADISGLAVRTTETRTLVDLPADTLFEFDRATLTPAAAANLAKLAELIRQSPPGPIEVVGHTDAKGDDAYNLKLAQQRAQSVVDWMGGQIGVRQRAFKAVGKGEAEPVVPNQAANGADDPDGRAKNRRVVVSIPR